MKNFLKQAKALPLIFIFGLAAWSSVGIAVAADDIQNKLNAAERSPLFLQKFSSSQITSRNFDRVIMQNGAELNFKKYTTLTRLDTNEKFQPLMNPQIVSSYLRSTPSYHENIIQMDDRLIVERTLNIEIKEGTCAQNELPAAVEELCFKEKDGEIPAESREYLVNFRMKLESTRPEVVIKQGRTAQQILTMSDKQLLEFLLNSDNRKIRLVSVLPTRVYSKQTPLNLWNTNTKLQTPDFQLSEARILSPNTQSMAVLEIPQDKDKPRNQVFPTNYFLTGFTIGRSIEDVFEIEFAGSTLFTDRYFVRFSYEFSAGFGLRFPFSVSASSKATDDYGPEKVPVDRPENAIEGYNTDDVPDKFQPLIATYYDFTSKQETASPARGTNRPSKATTQTAPVTSKSYQDKRFEKPTLGSGEVLCDGNNCGSGGRAIKSAEITMSVAPVNVSSNGQPVYSAVGLPQNKYFDGKEFVLKFSASCAFKASIPGPDINVSCPTINKDYGRQINPVIGNARAELGELWIDGTALGLGINVWAGKASVDFGIQANITNGQINMTAKGFNGTTIRGEQNSAFKFSSTSPISFEVKNTSGSTAFELTSPSYGFDLEILPVARMKLNLDLGFYELNKTLGPYGIDALSLTLASFTLPHHEGTVKSHIYRP